jgi:hypothetical protein
MQQPQWTKKQLEKIYVSYNECVYVAEIHGWQKKKVETKNSQDKKKK